MTIALPPLWPKLNAVTVGFCSLEHGFKDESIGLATKKWPQVTQLWGVLRSPMRYSRKRVGGHQ
ncbi:hypothetical protein [Pajaroellobacter abortibovis]|uniref:hypothetical protein n=1 Tax=Pajaroellobacter abortibovis TaxID=1882918 RepID=UPI0012EB88B4|nr:hypothetical protein [Pajaroellobacter abortibovis]